MNDPYANLGSPKSGYNLTPVAAHLYVPPITWKGDPIGHIGKYDCFFFLLQGECYIKIEENSFVLRPGQLAFLPKGRMRTYTSMSRELSMYEIAFDFKIGERHWCDAMEYSGDCFCVDVKDTQYVSTLFETSVRHEYIKDICHDLQCYANFVQILNTYIRARSEAEAMAIPFEGTVRFMESNLNTSLKVGELAKIACMETTYFIKKFKSAFGITPINYLNKLRIYRSMTLLLSTDLSIEKISEEVGIFDISYYSKMFKHYCTISPSEYRKLFRR